MVVIYDSLLTEPPSSINCFRDVTLYVDVFLKSENLIRCPKGTRSMYWKWIKRYGAHDFIKELIAFDEHQEGLLVGKKKNIDFAVLNEKNYGNMINLLKSRLIF